MQGVQAQSLANVLLALDRDLEIVPVINKIDLPAADLAGTAVSRLKMSSVSKQTIHRLFRQVCVGCDEILERLLIEVPPPKEPEDTRLRALVLIRITIPIAA